MSPHRIADAVFLLTLCVAALVAALAGGCLAVLVFYPQIAGGLTGLALHPWWFVYASTGANTARVALWSLAAAIAISLAALPWGLRARALYVRSSSPLALFFFVYPFTLFTECLRGPSALIYAQGGSQTLVLVLSRAVYGGRFAGELALLLVGLYALDFSYRRYSLVCGLLVAASLAIAAYTPVDGTVFLSTYTCALGDERGTWFVEFALALLGPAALAGAAISRKSKEYLVLCAASVVLIACREVSAFTAPLAAVATAFVLTAVGCWVFTSVLRRLQQS